VKSGLWIPVAAIHARFLEMMQSGGWAGRRVPDACGISAAMGLN
jgi:hypothetical protein